MAPVPPSSPVQVPGTDDDVADADLDVSEALEGELVSSPGSMDLGGVEIVPVASEDARGLATVPRLERFLSQIKRYALLSEEEERSLARRVRDDGDGDAARRLVLHNLRLVVTIAYEFRRAWSNVMDLVQEGSVGLVEAVKRWDPDRGARLGTYAGYWIRAYVLRYILTNFRLVHVGNTRAGRRLFFQLERERQKLLGAGIDPSPARLAANLGVDEKDVREVGGHLQSPEMPLDVPRGDEGQTLSDELGGMDEDPEQAAVGSEMAEKVHGLTRDFGTGLTDDRERAVWTEHLLAEEPISLGDLGTRFGVSKQRMGQIANDLKKRFREEITRRFGPGVELSWLVKGARG